MVSEYLQCEYNPPAKITIILMIPRQEVYASGQCLGLYSLHSAKLECVMRKLFYAEAGLSSLSSRFPTVLGTDTGSHMSHFLALSTL